MCKKILTSQKKAILNFYIWVDQKSGHYSTVVNMDDYYIFLDSGSIYFKRWPNRSLISQNDKDKLFRNSYTIPANTAKIIYCDEEEKREKWNILIMS